MSDLNKASAEALEAARQSDQFAVMLAAIQAVQQQAPACQHQAPVQQSSGGAVKWVGIGVGASVFLLAVAVSAVAIAISAVALTVCVLVLRSMWADYQKGK